MYKFLRATIYVLVIVGGLNWGLVGLFGFDLVAFLFGQMSTMTRIIYAIIGLCAILAPIFASSMRANCICSED